MSGPSFVGLRLFGASGVRVQGLGFKVALPFSLNLSLECFGGLRVWGPYHPHMAKSWSPKV